MLKRRKLSHEIVEQDPRIMNYNWVEIGDGRLHVCIFLVDTEVWNNPSNKLTVLPLSDAVVGHLIVAYCDHDRRRNQCSEEVHHHPGDEELVPIAKRSNQQSQTAQNVNCRQSRPDVQHIQRYCE